MALGTMLLLGGAAALFVLSSKPKAQPGQGWSPPAPGVGPGTPIELRQIEGEMMQCFVPAVADSIMGMLSQSYLVPAQAPSVGGLAFFVVRSITEVGAVPGMQNARSIVLSAAEAGLTVLGSATLPYPASSAGRQVAIGDPAGRQLAAAANRQPFAVLCDKAQFDDPPYYEGAKED